MAKTIRILFDAHPLIGQKTGVGYYTSQLISHLASQYPDEVELIGYYHNFLFRKPRISSPVAPNISYRAIWLFPGQVVNLLRRLHLAPTIELLTLTRADFILYPNYLGLKSMFNTPYAPVIHDLTFIDHPESMSEKNRNDLTRFVPSMIKNARFVITVSDFTKNRLAADLASPQHDTVVTHIPPALPLNIDAKRRRLLLKESGITDPFILFVGTMEPRKNLINLLDAYAMLPKATRQRYALVIAGKMDWKFTETKDKIEELQQQGLNIIYTGYVSDELRGCLYKEASLFVLPSYYEGFGMPILEAFSYDTPCAISDIPVFHEVAGDAATYFDPYNSKNIARVIFRELSGKSSVTTPTRTNQLRQFSWKKVCELLYLRIRREV